MAIDIKGDAKPTNEPDRSQQKRKHEQAFTPHEGDGGQGGGGEVGGRHAVLLNDGTIGYHSNWLTGPYVWHRDGEVYFGPHWHPNRFSPLAYDVDD